MGTHLYFKVEDESNTKQANEFVEQTPEHKELENLHEYVQRIYFYEEDIYPGVGAGDIKTNSLPEKEEAIELYTRIFEKLHSHPDFDVKILTKSCSLRLRTFSFDQIVRLTDGGDALSGEGKHEYRRMIDKVQAVEELPSEFTNTFTKKGELVLEEPPNMDLFDLEGDELYRLGDLLRDRRRVQMLDLLLTFSTEGMTYDIIEQHSEFDTDDMDKAIKELDLHDMIEYERLDQSHRFFDELYRVHNELILKNKPPKHTNHTKNPISTQNNL